ncbi:hypothetical protein O1611_g10541 [Lasiodiplodia mahajangana]|uniref:Uncharacterized protein n=1 Tax=Lasiodiplodia mahajangana TaxID=1108764 RepID=A0ACC2IX90_9PEZI|nr:hypothetical protein O1611_g10541 [Lasiodiplodia mahajangana]
MTLLAQRGFSIEHCQPSNTLKNFSRVGLQLRIGRMRSSVTTVCTTNIPHAHKKPERHLKKSNLSAKSRVEDFFNAALSVQQQQSGKMAPLPDDIVLIPYRRSSRNGGDCSHPRVPPTVVTLDPYGDMMLVVGRQKCTDKLCNVQRRPGQPDPICFHVNSAVVAGASPSFGLALYSPSAEAPRADGVRWTVKLPDDDPRAMQTIVNILYGQYPTSTTDAHMNLQQLLNLTVLADKYDLVHLFPRWVAQWEVDRGPGGPDVDLLGPRPRAIVHLHGTTDRLLQRARCRWKTHRSGAIALLHKRVQLSSRASMRAW